MKKTLILAIAALAIVAPAALAASGSLKVTPKSVSAGKTVTVSGSVGSGCQTGHKGDSATIYSGAFKGATSHEFAGVPSVSVSLSNSKHGAFSIKIKLANKVKKGNYTVAGRCGGGRFGSTTLTVTKAPSSAGGGGGGFY